MLIENFIYGDHLDVKSGIKRSSAIPYSRTGCRLVKEAEPQKRVITLTISD